MNEIDILDIELMQILVDDEIKRHDDVDIKRDNHYEARLFELHQLRHKLEVIRKSR